MLTLWKNKPNTSTKSVSLPFNLHGSQRGLSFYLYLVYLCPLTAATTNMMYWETGNMKIWKIIKKETFHLRAVLLQLPYCIHGSQSASRTCYVNRQFKYQYVIWHTCTCPADNLEKKLVWTPGPPSKTGAT